MFLRETEGRREISSKEGLILRHRGHNHTSRQLNSTRVAHSNIGAMRLRNQPKLKMQLACQSRDETPEPDCIPPDVFQGSWRILDGKAS